MKIFGKNDGASRIPVALGGLGGVAATALFGIRFFGVLPGLLGGWILGSSLIWSIHAQLNLIDMTLTFFLSLGLFAYYLGIRSSRRWLLLFYASAALAVLAKGLIGVVLPGAIIFLWICWRREWRLIIRSISLPGIVLFLAITLPWFAEVWRRNPEFGWFFFVHEHFLRYTTTIHSRYEPWWFFLPILFAGTLPWTGGVLRGFRRTYREQFPQAQEDGLFSYLFLWFAVILLFFSLSGSKLIPYILPLFPPLALFGSLGMQSMREREISRKKKMLFVFWPLLFAIALVVYALKGTHVPLDGVFPVVGFLGIVPAFLGLYFVLHKKSQGSPSLLLLVILLGASYLGGVKCLGPLLEPTLSGKALAELIQEERLPEETVLCYATYVQGLPFYLKERVALGEYEGELAFGKNQDPEGSREWFLSREDVQNLWKDPERRVLLILPNEDTSFWERLDLTPGIFLGTRGKMLLFRKNMENTRSTEQGIEENLKIHDYTARHIRENEEEKP
jgi:4-amino-4-deoxy-L-arabinose transferase-like glycosyltransferase